MTDYKPVFMPNTWQPKPGKRELEQPALVALAIGAIGLMAVIVYLISVYLPGDKGRLSQAHNRIEKLLQENAALSSELEEVKRLNSNQFQAIESLQAEIASQHEVLTQINKLTQQSKGEK